MTAITNRIGYGTAALLLLLCQNATVLAQCPMCKGAAEANLREGGTAALGLNTGILYLLFVPYAIVLLLGYLWWRNNRKVEAAELQLLQVRAKAEQATTQY